MLDVIAAVAVLSLGAGAGTQLSRVTGAQVKVEGGDGLLYSHEKGVAPADAKAIYEHRRRGGESVPVIVRVPGRAGLFLVSDLGPPDAPANDYGRRLFLLQRVKDGFRELGRTRGVGDAYNLDPVVFTGAGRTVVLAELGTEYSWGLVAYEIAGRELRELGAIGVAAPGEEGERDPTPFARVHVEGGRLVVAFDVDMIEDPGGQHAKALARPVVFRQEGKRFVRVQPR